MSSAITAFGWPDVRATAQKFLPGRKSQRKSLIIKFSEVSGLCHSVATFANVGGIGSGEESEVEEVEEKMEVPKKGATTVP